MNKAYVYAQTESIKLRHMTGNDLIGHIQDMIKDIGTDAPIEIDIRYDYDNYSEVYLNLAIHREETDQEYIERMCLEEIETKRIEDDEKETYLRLKAKFENKE